MSAVAAYLFDNEQLAVISAAEHFADQLLADSMAPVHKAYGDRKVASADEAARIRTVCGAARRTHVLRAFAQRRVEAKSGEVRTDLGDIGHWGDELDGALNFAGITGHPLAAQLDILLLGGDKPAETYQDGTQDLLAALHAGKETGAFADLPLPDGFLEKGQALFDELIRDRSDAARAEMDRKMFTALLHSQLAEIERVIRGLDALRPAVSRVVGFPVPGFDFTLLHAASARAAAGSAPTNGATVAPPAQPGVIQPLQA